MFLNSRELILFLPSGWICSFGNTPIVINLILYIVVDSNSQLNCIQAARRIESRILCLKNYRSQPLVWKKNRSCILLT